MSVCWLVGWGYCGVGLVDGGPRYGLSERFGGERWGGDGFGAEMRMGFDQRGGKGGSVVG